MISLLLRCLNVQYSQWYFLLVPRHGSSLYFKLYADNDKPNTTIPYQRTNYFVTINVDNTPLPFKSMHCQFDGDNFRCNWDGLAAFLDSRSLPKGISAEAMCFGHLEGRDRPQIIDGNMPWWLAAVISLPLVAVTLFYINRWMKRKGQHK